MEEVGAIRVFNAWRNILVKGQPDQLDQLESEIARRFLALGWSPDTALEKKMNSNPQQINRFICWVGGPGGGPRLLLCLNRATPRRLRGGTYSWDDNSSGASMAEVVQDALNKVLEPAAAAVGLAIAYPHFAISRVGPRTFTIMAALAEAADGQWPLPAALETAWRRFVVTACHDDVAFDPGELERWFGANGWDAKASANLTKRFYADAANLGEYDEAEERRVCR